MNQIYVKREIHVVTVFMFTLMNINTLINERVTVVAYGTLAYLTKDLT